MVRWHTALAAQIIADIAADMQRQKSTRMGSGTVPTPDWNLTYIIRINYVYKA